MLEAKDPNSSCSRLCTCGLGQQLKWNYTERLSRCLMVLDCIRMMSRSSHPAKLLFPLVPASSWGHHLKSLEKLLGWVGFFLKGSPRSDGASRSV